MLYETSKRSLISALNFLGIKNGSVLYVSSDIKTFLFQLAMGFGIRTKEQRNEALNELINDFQKAVGPEGTLLFPVFSWDWCRGNGFDIKKTKGEVGTLSNWVLENRADFRRTRHPIYSFMVWGKDAALLEAMDNQDAWSHKSPFYYFQTHKAKQLLFNIEAYQGLTFGHYIEQEVSVPYRHPKYFFGDYTDENGITEKRMYYMYVRDMGFESGCGIHNDWLIAKGVAIKTEWKKNQLVVVDLEKSYPIIYDDMVQNNGKNTLSFSSGHLDLTKKQTLEYEVKGIEI